MSYSSTFYAPRSSKPEKPEKTNELKILVQYRAKRGRVYELKSGEGVLAVHISPRETPTDGGDWHVEARGMTATDGPCVEGWGATPVEALTDAARAWVSHVPPLTAFNWEAVARELHVVQAV